MKRSGRNPGGAGHLSYNFLSSGFLVTSGEVVMPDPTWQALYRAALVEIDPIKLKGRIEVARWSIRQRLEQIEDSDTRERQQLNDALGALFTLVARKRSA